MYTYIIVVAQMRENSYLREIKIILRLTWKKSGNSSKGGVRARMMFSDFSNISDISRDHKKPCEKAVFFMG